MLLEFATANGASRPFAVLLLDVCTDQLHIKALGDFTSVATPEDAPILEGLVKQLATDAAEIGGGAVLSGLEDTLSNAVRISDRTRLDVQNIPATLADLYALRVLSV